MAWLKYNYKWAWGIEKQFHYLEIDPYYIETSTIENLIDDHELHEKYNWSDKYRGINYEIVDVPPRDYLAELFCFAEDRIRHYEAEKKRIAKIIEEHYGVS